MAILKISLTFCAVLAVGASMAVFTSAAPQPQSAVSGDVQLLSGDELIVMSGTGTQTPIPAEIATVNGAAYFYFH
jgi:hypothetical protein